MAAIDGADIEVSSRYGTWDPDDLHGRPAGRAPARARQRQQHRTGLPADGSDLPAG